MGTDEVSIEDSIREAMGEVSEASESTPEPVEAPATPEPKVDVPEPKAARAAKTQSEAPKVEEEVEGDPAQPEIEVEEDSDYDVPKFLDAAEREEFKKLPKEVRALADRFVRRRDLANQRWVSKVRQEAQEHIQQAVSPYGALDQVLEPHVHRLGLQGKDIATTINSTLLWDKLIDENPVEALAQLCTQKRVTPRQLFDYLEGNGSSQGEAASSGGSQPSGGDSELRSVITSLQTEVQNLKQGGVRSQWAGVVSQLASTRDAQGNPAYPYYEDVRPEMAEWTKIVGSQHPEYNPAQLFKAAYDRAAWANESVRALLIQEQMGQRASSSIAKKRAASSLPASSNGLASRPKTTPQSESASIEQSILEAADSLGVEF